MITNLAMMQFFTNFLALTAITTTSLALTVPKSVATTCSAVGISDARAAKVEAAFSNTKIALQAVNNFDSKVEVSVSYKGKAANLGTVFTIPQATLRPTITFTAEADHDPATTKYMIFFVDPDAPGPTGDGSPAALSFFLHQATYNASPSCINPSNNGGGEDVTVPGYRALTPLSVERHRYLQLVYRQPEGFTKPTQLALVTAGLDLNGFVKANGLVSVGGNYLTEGAADLL